MEDFDYIKFLEEENRYAHGILRKLEDENTRMKNILYPVEYILTIKGERKIFRTDLNKLPTERLKNYFENCRRQNEHIRKQKQATSSYSK